MSNPEQQLFSVIAKLSAQFHGAHETLHAGLVPQKSVLASLKWFSSIRANDRTVFTSRQRNANWASPQITYYPHELLFRKGFVQQSYMLKQLEWLNTWNSSGAEIVVNPPPQKQVRLLTGLLLVLLHRVEPHHSPYTEIKLIVMVLTIS